MNKKKILIIDIFDRKRSPYQNFIYEYLEKIFIVKKLTRIYAFFSLHSVKKFDIVYFGICHNQIHRKGLERLKLHDLNYVLSKMSKDQILVVDQADTEFFMKDNSGKQKIEFNRYFQGKKILLDKLSSNELKNFAKMNNFILVQLPWMIKPEDYKEIDLTAKDIDVAFISTINFGSEFHEKRIDILNNLLILQKERSDLKFFISAPPLYPENTVYGEDYIRILNRSKVFIAEGSNRLCMTQKYLEAGLAGCLIIGDKPLYPENNIFMKEELMIETDLTDYTLLDNSISYSISNYSELSKKIQKCFLMIKENHNIENEMKKFIHKILDKTEHN